MINHILAFISSQGQMQAPGQFKRSLLAILKMEDWWAVWLGFAIIVLALTKIVKNVPGISPWSGNPFMVLPLDVVTNLLLLGLGIALVTAVAVFFIGDDVKKYLKAFPLVFAFAVLASILGNQTAMREYGFDNVVWSLVIGLVISNI